MVVVFGRQRKPGDVHSNGRGHSSLLSQRADLCTDSIGLSTTNRRAIVLARIALTCTSDNTKYDIIFPRYSGCATENFVQLTEQWPYRCSAPMGMTTFSGVLSPGQGRRRKCRPIMFTCHPGWRTWSHQSHDAHLYLAEPCDQNVTLECIFFPPANDSSRKFPGLVAENLRVMCERKHVCMSVRVCVCESDIRYHLTHTATAEILQNSQEAITKYSYCWS
jgi:hypothetical protein